MLSVEGLALRIHSTPEDNYLLTLRTMMQWNMVNFRTGDVNSVNTLLETLDVKAMLPQIMSASLRSTAARAHNLPAWAPFRDKVVAEFQRREIHNWRSILRGVTTDTQSPPSTWAGDLDRVLFIHPSLIRK